MESPALSPVSAESAASPINQEGTQVLIGFDVHIPILPEPSLVWKLAGFGGCRWWQPFPGNLLAYVDKPEWKPEGGGWRDGETGRLLGGLVLSLAYGLV